MSVDHLTRFAIGLLFFILISSLAACLKQTQKIVSPNPKGIDPYVNEMEIVYERVAGGTTRHNSINLVPLSGGNAAIIEVIGKEIWLHRGMPGKMNSELLTQNGGQNYLVKDSGGVLHIVFRNKRSDRWIYANTGNKEQLPNPDNSVFFNLLNEEFGPFRNAVQFNPGMFITYIEISASGEIQLRGREWVEPTQADENGEKKKVQKHFLLTWNGETWNRKETEKIKEMSPYNFNRMHNGNEYRISEKTGKGFTFSSNHTGELKKQFIEDITFSRLMNFIVDEKGNAHVCYRTFLEEYRKKELLKKSTFQGGFWNRKPAIWNPDQIPLKLKQATTIADGDAGFKYATNKNGFWEIHNLWENGTAWESELHVDENGSAYVGYIAQHEIELLRSKIYFHYSTNAMGKWEHHIFDYKPDIYDSAPIAMHSNADPYVAYTDYATEEFRLAMRDESGHWKSQLVDSGRWFGECANLSIDTYGSHHLIYWDHEVDKYRYGTNSSGDWLTYPLDFAGHTVEARYDKLGYRRDQRCANSMAAGKNGDVHISYSAIEGEGLKYAVKRNGKWKKKIIDQKGDAAFTSIAVDSKGKAHIAYYDLPAKVIKYAYQKGNDWRTEIVGPSGMLDLFGDTSLALDSKGNAHILYIKNAKNDQAKKNYRVYPKRQLFYANNEKGSWQINLHEEKLQRCEGRPLAIGVDGNDKLHGVLACHDVQYFTNTHGDWIKKIIDRAYTHYGVHPFLKVDQFNNVHLSYVGEGAAWHTIVPKGYIETLKKDKSKEIEND